MPTLQELAAIEAANPNNPFAYGLSQGMAGTPAAKAMEQGVAPPLAATLNPPPPPAPAPGPVRPAPGAAPAGPAGPSADREYEKASGEIAESNQEILAKERENTLDKKEIYSRGIQAGADAGKKLQAEDELSDQNNEAAAASAKADWATREADRKAKADALRQQHVDPQKWFKERGTAGSILAALAMGAGAFGAAMPHTSGAGNTALDIINKSIDKDINAQQGEIEQQWKALDYQGTQDDKAYARDMHMEAQRNQRRLTNYDHARAMVSDLRQRTSDELQAKGLDDVDAGLAQKQNEYAQKQIDLHHNVALREQAQAAAQAHAAKSEANKLEERYAEYHDQWQKSKKDQPLLSKGEWLSQAMGSGAEAQPQAGKEGKLSPRLAGTVVSAEQGEKAAGLLVKENPYTQLTASPAAMQGMEALKSSLDNAEPGVDHDWVMNPIHPKWKGRVAEAQTLLQNRSKRIQQLGKGAAEEAGGEGGGVPGAPLAE